MTKLPFTFPRWLAAGFLLFVATLGSVRAEAPEEKLPPVFLKKAPESVAELKAIQEQVEKVVVRVMPAVVCVRIGGSVGSGVIVTKDGYVLTAGHVSGEPDRDVTIYFHDGKKAKGKTLGGNHGLDSGLIKITTEGEWPTAPMGNSAKIQAGDWCLVCSHPGGFKTGRTPPVRVGRVLKNAPTAMVTDCTLVGGDSGGPVFDMHGRVIGINSRIGQAITANIHVPVDPYRETWDRLVASEVWGGKLALGKPGPWLGVQTIQQGKDCLIQMVFPGSPAEKAGLKAMDIIQKFAGANIDSPTTLADLVQRKKPGDQITIDIQRGAETLSLKVEIGKR